MISERLCPRHAGLYNTVLTTRVLRGESHARAASSFALTVSNLQQTQVVVGLGVTAAHGEEDAGALLGARGRLRDRYNERRFCRGFW